MQQVAGNGGLGDGTQVEALAARKDGGENLVRLSGREDEFTWGGGSSSVFNRALKALVVSMWTSSM